MAMRFPTPYTIGWHAYSEGPADAHGNATEVYTPPKNDPGTSVAVIGWAKRDVQPPRLDGEHRSVTDIQLMVPPGFVPNLRDLFDLPEGQFEVISQPWTAEGNPFGWNPGSFVNLRKVDG